MSSFQPRYVDIICSRYTFVSPKVSIVLALRICKRMHIRGRNWVHFTHGLKYTVTLNSNFVILKT